MMNYGSIQPRNNSPWLRIMVISIVLHLVFLLGLPWWIDWMGWKIDPTWNLQDQKVSDSIEFDIAPKTDLHKKDKQEKFIYKNRQIVSQNEKSVNREKPIDEKSYLGRIDQKVERETRAARTGHFQIAQKGGKPKLTDILPQFAPHLPPHKMEMEQEKQEQAENGELTQTQKTKALKNQERLQAQARPFSSPVFADQTNTNTNTNNSGAEGPAQDAQTDDYLKDVAKGNDTLLNTREFIYYSYYNRIKERLQQYWEPKIKEKIERIFRQGRRLASTNAHITKVVIVLNRNGDLVNVELIGASGTTDLDDAAVEAFRSAAPFPHPPRGLVEADGFIRIRWDFVLEA